MATRPFREKKASFKCLLFVFFLVFLIVTLGGVAVFWLAYKHGQNLGISAFKSLRFPQDDVITSKECVPENYLINPTGSNRHYNYISTIMYLFQSSYKHTGSYLKFLEPHTFVSFSQDRLEQYITDNCLNINLTLGEEPTYKMNAIEFYETYKNCPGIRFQILPSSCKYDQKEQICHLKSHNSKVYPIYFEMLQPEFITGVNKIREFLHVNQSPLELDMPSIVQRFWKPCAINSSSIACQMNLYRCPSDINTYCMPIDFEVPDFLMAYNLSTSKSQFVAGNRKTYALLGYNDAIPLKQKNTNETMEDTSGAFIVRSQTQSNGHTITYLMGNYSINYENIMCPNLEDVFHWIPADLECIKKKMNIRECSTDQISHYFKEAKFGATPLKCTDPKKCNMTSQYVLPINNNQNEDSIDTPIIELTENGVYERIIEDVPKAYLYKYFKIADVSVTLPDRCGYHVLPYETLRMIQGTPEGTQNVGAYRVSFQWKTTSFARSHANYQYQQVIDSTEYYDALEHEAPIISVDL